MPGNEKEIAKYLVANKGKVSLRHLGVVASVGAPNLSIVGCKEISNVKDVDVCLASEDSRKKADVYINGHGVSIKQSGPSELFNRLQRDNILNVFTQLNIKNPAHILQLLDREVLRFHNGNLETRNRPWEDFFSEQDFKTLLCFLITIGSPNVGVSMHPVEFILEAPQKNISEGNIDVFTFEEYFEKYKSDLKIAIRRVWYGQASNSEHGRAKSLMNKEGNVPWVINGVSGMPKIHRSGQRWRKDIPTGERKTIYFLMIEKES